MSYFECMIGLGVGAEMSKGGVKSRGCVSGPCKQSCRAVWVPVPAAGRRNKQLCGVDQLAELVG